MHPCIEEKLQHYGSENGVSQYILQIIQKIVLFGQKPSDYERDARQNAGLLSVRRHRSCARKRESAGHFVP